MIIWLASYPRAGNTMLRMILKSVFGQETYSKYDDLKDIAVNQKTMELVGHKMLGDSWENAYQAMRRSEKIFFIKTHDYPEDNSRAIYLVRDGRASLVSYWHYLEDFASKKYSLPDMIAGFVLFGSWGAHLDAWNPLNRPNTLLIKYEQLLTDPDEEIEKISSFIGLNTVGDWRNDFEYFHKINPRFFRQGHALKGIKEIQGDDLDIFWLFHGDWMETLGYAENDKVCKNKPALLREKTRKLYKKFESGKTDYKTIRRERDAILNSLSWKITAPARSIVRFIKGGRAE